MFKGPKGPVSGRTPRTQAEKYADPASFPAEPAYSTQGGHPITPGMPQTLYKGSPHQEPVQSSSPHQGAAPFTLGQK